MKTLVVCKHPNNAQEKKACHLIQHEGFEIVYAWKNTLTKKQLKDIELVISLGGDGTALSASHFLTNAPLLAVNDSPETSVGALTTITLDQLHDKLKDIKTRRVKTEPLQRIHVKINNHALEHLALNEVFIANRKAYLTSKYHIQYKKIKEAHYSSGLIFSTGTGSTAWYRSAGGKPFSPQSKTINMIVREPYHGRIRKPKHTTLSINKKEFVTITPEVPSVLAIDSIREHHLKPSDNVRIEIAKEPLIRIK